jgi:hypothetical protein
MQIIFYRQVQNQTMKILIQIWEIVMNTEQFTHSNGPFKARWLSHVEDLVETSRCVFQFILVIS